MLTIGESLKKLRLQNGLTQKEMAENLNVSYQTISKWELDKSLPSLEMIVSISLLYDVSIDSIIFNQEECHDKSYFGGIFKKKKRENNLKEGDKISKPMNKRINHSSDVENLFDEKATYISLYNEQPQSMFEDSADWLLSLVDSDDIELANRTTKAIYKIASSELEKVSFSLAKSFLGAGPGIFFTTKLILEIELTFKESNKQLLLLSNSTSIFNELYSYFSYVGIKIIDILDLKTVLKDVEKEKISEFIYENIDDIMKKNSITELTFYRN